MEIFTNIEKHILERTNKCYKWIARDEDGDMYFYERMPYRDEDAGIFNTDDGNVCFAWDKSFSDTLFSSVTWENSPIQYRDDLEPLTPKEREYLKFVFRPFASHIKYVQKMRSDDTEYIVARTYKDSIIFPYFIKGTMYKGMKLETKYELKELGIEYNE